MKIRTRQDIFIDIVIYTLLIFVAIVCLYPMLYVIFASLSEPTLLMANKGLLVKPLGFTLEGYNIIFKDQGLITGFKNTLFYLTTGVAVNMLFTIMGAYCLSRKNMMLRKPLMLFITFTMFFSGGLIPFFLLVKDLGLYNSWLALVFPYAINTWNMIIMRTGFESFPAELEEAAKIDGASDLYILLQLILPLSKAVLSVILLYYVVGAWNAWFPSMIFLKGREKFPLQLLLREILIVNDTAAMQQNSAATGGAFEISTAYRELVKYCTIVVATIPILCFYPAIQKHFVKGVYVGSLKG